MPTADDLMGLGMPPDMAAQLGNQPSNLTATGTTQATAALALTKNVYINAQASQTGVILNAGSKIGSPHYFANGTASAASALIYAPTGHLLNGVASSTPLTLAQNRMATVLQIRLKEWYTETGL